MQYKSLPNIKKAAASLGLEFKDEEHKIHCRIEIISFDGDVAS